MERLEVFLGIFDEALGTKKRRYVIGGILMSVSLFFGGLSVTVMVINRKERGDEYE
jgi:hypothetical protein